MRTTTTAEELGVTQIFTELKTIAGSNDPNIIFEIKMPEKPKPFLNACLVTTWVIPVIGFLTFGFVFWSLAMKTTGVGLDGLIYPMTFCWIVLPGIGLLAGFLAVGQEMRNVKIRVGVPLAFNLIYSGFAVFLIILLALGKM